MTNSDMEKFVNKLKEDFFRWGGGVADDGNNEVHQREMKTCYEKHLETVNDSLKRKIQAKVPPYYEDFLFHVAYFWLTGRGVYSSSIVHDIIKEKEKELSKNELLALEHLQRFLRTHLSTDGYIKVSSDDEVPTAKKIISHFNKPQLTKIDGMESLLYVLGEDGFIKAVIENSYFFNPKLIQSQFAKIAQSIAAGENIPARKSTQENIYQLKGDKRIFVDGDFKCPIMLDKDGNAEVRRVINAATGYTISQGKGSIFQNYYISHVWGRAYDPRYFTSLWNLAIVPAWGNSLMDKMADEDTDEVERLAAKLKATMKAVCWRLYDMDNLNWESIKMKAPQLNDAIKLDSQVFSVRILEGDMRIVRKDICIQ